MSHQPMFLLEGELPGGCREIAQGFQVAGDDGVCLCRKNRATRWGCAADVADEGDVLLLGEFRRAGIEADEFVDLQRGAGERDAAGQVDGRVAVGRIRDHDGFVAALRVEGVVGETERVFADVEMRLCGIDGAERFLALHALHVGEQGIIWDRFAVAVDVLRLLRGGLHRAGEQAQNGEACAENKWQRKLHEKNDCKRLIAMRRKSKDVQDGARVQFKIASCSRAWLVGRV